MAQTERSGPREKAAPVTNTLSAMVARRRLAALRMVPMWCGCRDPLSRGHLADQCRWARTRRFDEIDEVTSTYDCPVDVPTGLDLDYQERDRLGRDPAYLARLGFGTDRRAA